MPKTSGGHGLIIRTPDFACGVDTKFSCTGWMPQELKVQLIQGFTLKLVPTSHAVNNKRFGVTTFSGHKPTTAFSSWKTGEHKQDAPNLAHLRYAGLTFDHRSRNTTVTDFSGHERRFPPSELRFPPRQQNASFLKNVASCKAASRVQSFTFANQRFLFSSRAFGLLELLRSQLREILAVLSVLVRPRS